MGWSSPLSCGHGSVCARWCATSGCVCVVRLKEKVSAEANQAATQRGPDRCDQGGLQIFF